MKTSVLKATVLVFVLSLLAKVIGFLKSIIQASFFGTTIETDAFNIANEFVSNILFMIATAVAVAFVPLYIQRKLQQDEKKFATRTITALALIAVGISGILAVIAPFVVKIIAPSYSGYELEITTKYFRVLVIGFSFALVTQLYSNLLNAEKVYGFSAFCSIINSIVLISFIFLFSKSWGVWALVVAMPISYFFQWLVLFLRGRRFATVSLKYGLRDQSIKLLAAQAVPILLSQATVEINQVVDRALLTSLGAGILTAVTYAVILYQFVSTIITTPLSTVMFTELAEAGAKKKYDDIINILNTCYKVLFLVCIPIILVMWFASTDIVNIIYGHGKFNEEAVINCATGLKIYGLCLLPVCIKAVLSRAYYSLNNTKRTMIMGMLEVALNIGLSVLLIKPFGVKGVIGATAISSLFFIIIMLIDFNRKFIKVLTKETIVSYWKITVGTALLIIIMYLLRNVFFINYLVNFLTKTIIAFGVYGVLLLIMKENTLFAVLKKAKGVIKGRLNRNNNE